MGYVVNKRVSLGEANTAAALFRLGLPWCSVILPSSSQFDHVSCIRPGKCSSASSALLRFSCPSFCILCRRPRSQCRKRSCFSSPCFAFQHLPTLMLPPCHCSSQSLAKIPKFLAKQSPCLTRCFRCSRCRLPLIACRTRGLQHAKQAAFGPRLLQIKRPHTNSVIVASLMMLSTCNFQHSINLFHHGFDTFFRQAERKPCNGGPCFAKGMISDKDGCCRNYWHSVPQCANVNRRNTSANPRKRAQMMAN